MSWPPVKHILKSELSNSAKKYYMTNANKVMAYRLSLWIGIPTSLIGFYLHRTDFILSDLVLAIGAICALIILVLGLIDIFSNNKIKKTEKIMWVSGFIFLTFIAGILFLQTFKKHNYTSQQ